jgi:hypothetical protein
MNTKQQVLTHFMVEQILHNFLYTACVQAPNFFISFSDDIKGRTFYFLFSFSIK